MSETLTARQRREEEYHRAHAGRMVDAPLWLDIIDPSQPQKWWIAQWAMYAALKCVVAGKDVLVPGSGPGDDAIRLAKLGARVTGFDLSPELVEVARARAGRTPVRFDICPAETLPYADASFDVVMLCDILHHVDIAPAMREVRRVLKPGGLIVGCELYTHSWVQRVRESRLVKDVLYPRMVRFIYGTDKPYITEDEHKIDEAEFGLVEEGFDDLRCQWFGILAGRLFPTRLAGLSKADRRLAKVLGPLGRFLAGRVVFVGRKR